MELANWCYVMLQMMSRDRRIRVGFPVLTFTIRPIYLCFLAGHLKQLVLYAS